MSCIWNSDSDVVGWDIWFKFWLFNLFIFHSNSFKLLSGLITIHLISSNHQKNKKNNEWYFVLLVNLTYEHLYTFFATIRMFYKESRGSLIFIQHFILTSLLEKIQLHKQTDVWSNAGSQYILLAFHFSSFQRNCCGFMLLEVNRVVNLYMYCPSLCPCTNSCPLIDSQTSQILCTELMMPSEWRYVHMALRLMQKNWRTEPSFHSEI
jgi:hypothetical protein